jgi:hypothetical protein
MPTLADIYSAIDSMKRRGSDFVQNPVTSLQQMLGNANDRARNLNELTARAAQETARTGQIYGNPAQEQLTNALADSYNPVGMTVWHGSPHVFERFDLGKMGTGEGAQMYGQGFYTAQQQDVAKRFTPRDINFENKLMQKYNQAEKTGDYTSMQIYEDFLAQKTPEEISSNFQNMGFSGKDLQTAQKAYDEAKKLYQGQQEGSLYKVDLPDTHIRRMLDWDAPLKDQPNHVRRLAKSLNMDLNDLGGDLVMKIGKTEEGKKALQDAGIPGIKYFDQMSRGDQTGSRNFVVFDPNHLTILERNAKPIK